MASLERMMWPVNWPGENQKGKSGGSLSWNSAWMLEGKGPAGSRFPAEQSLPTCPLTSAPKPGTLGQTLCGAKGWAGEEEVCGAGRRDALQVLPILQGPVHVLPSPEALPKSPLSPPGCV